MTKLNSIGKNILKAKRAKFVANSEFSLAFLGDSHVGMKNCKCQANCAEARYKSLLRRIKNMKPVYVSVLGGDASDRSQSLEKFAVATKTVLDYHSAIKDELKTPLFVNVGNHDYHNGQLETFQNIIGSENEIIRLFGNVKGPRVAVVMIDSGYTVSGKLPGTDTFRKNLAVLEKKMAEIIKKHSTVRFIIDMHIPPRIPHELSGTHVLNPTFNHEFRKFLKKHPAGILAIVCHHKHGQVHNSAYHLKFMTSKEYAIPVFVTAQGGQCNPNKAPHQDAQYSFIRIDLIHGITAYKIKNVYRYEMVYDQTKKHFVLKPRIRLPLK